MQPKVALNLVHRPGWPLTHDPFAPVSQMLESHVCVTMPSISSLFQ
jgi:hypothetical protein